MSFLISLSLEHNALKLAELWSQNTLQTSRKSQFFLQLTMLKSLMRMRHSRVVSWQCFGSRNFWDGSTIENTVLAPCWVLFWRRVQGRNIVTVSSFFQMRFFVYSTRIHLTILVRLWPSLQKRNWNSLKGTLKGGVLSLKDKEAMLRIAIAMTFPMEEHRRGWAAGPRDCFYPPHYPLHTTARTCHSNLKI